MAVMAAMVNMRHVGGAVIGLAVWAGLVAAWRGWTPHQAGLAERLVKAGRPPAPQRTLRQRVLDVFAGDSNATHTSLHADLAVLDRSLETYATNRLVLVAGLAAMPVVFALATSAAGALAWSPVSVAVVAVVGAGFGLVMSRAVITSQAAERRRGFAIELSQFLDIVALQVAGASGIDDALRRAAAGSVSPGIAQIRRALDRARTRNESPWDSLEALAERTRVPELDELVSTVRLGDDRGARIRATLVAKADSLRATQSADELARSEKASERMGIPVVAMFFGFLTLMLAPLMAQLAGL